MRTAYTDRMDWRKYIVATPGTRSGKPRIDGTRITVQDVMEYLRGGMTPAELIEEFDALTEDNIAACIAYDAEKNHQDEPMLVAAVR